MLVLPPAFGLFFMLGHVQLSPRSIPVRGLILSDGLALTREMIFLSVGQM